MANINNITSNSYSSSSTSLYGNRNVLTGLASGMDTEAMIQNSVAGYQTKITELQQSTTKLEWKQDAYRALTDQMYAINQKYMSYTSKTNLSSNSFFNNAITTTAQGTNAAAVSASGSAKSDIQINAVTQLASAARYSVDASALSINATNSLTGNAIDWSANEAAGLVKGTLTLKYGSENIELKFDENDDEINTPEGLKNALVEKLSGIQVKTTKGTTNASNLFTIDISEDKTFTIGIDETNGKHDGSKVYISKFTGNLAEKLGVQKPASTELTDKFANTSFTVSDFDALTKNQNMAEYLNGKTVNVTLNGSEKQIKIGDLTGTEVQVGLTKMSLDDAISAMNQENITDEYKNDLNKAISTAMNNALQNDLQTSIDKAFGAGKMTVELKDGGLDFVLTAGSGATLKVSSEAGEKLGIGKAGVSNYFNTSKTIGDLISSGELDSMRLKAEGDVDPETVRYYDKNGVRLIKEGDTYYQADSKGNAIKKDGEMVEGKYDHTAYTDEDGNLVMKREGEEEYYRVNEKGEELFELKINGATIGGLTKSSTLESVINSISSNAEAGVKVGYSNLTSQFVFTANETGEGGKIDFENPLAKKLFAVDNSPQSVTLEKFFGDAVSWDGNGNAALKFSAPRTGAKELGTLSKDMTVDELFAQIKTLGPDFQDIFNYDEKTGTYSFVKPEDSSRYSFRQIGVMNGFGLSGLLDKFTGGTWEAGKDAEINATVNGKTLSLKRSTNTLDMDGMSVTLNETFSAYGEDGKVSKADAVTFKTSSNADDIVAAVKGFVEDVNKLMTDLHSAYATQPAEKNSSKHTKYEPLTEDDKKDMSESAINAYEEKAKQGLLFGDSDLSTLYGKLRDAIQSYGSDRVTLESIGLSTTYSGGVTTFSFDETKLRDTLASDPDKVRTAFTKTVDGGSATNGLMATLKTTINAYASTSIATPGILVRKAGTKLSSMSLLSNNLQKQIDSVNTQIENWQTKLSSKIDYYTKQFTALEKLMSTMNNQSSMLADLMGY